MHSFSRFPSRILATFLVGALATSSPPLYAAQNPTVVGYIGDYRSNDASLPSASNQKGKLGSILAEIFGTGSINGKIKQDYLDLTGLVSTWLLNGSDTYYNTGKVGIGTASPVTKLSVTTDGTTKTPYDTNELFQFHGGTATYGTVSNDSVTLGIGTYDSGNDGIFTSSAEGGFVGTINSAPLNFRVANNEKMRIDTNGNVGIGTINPLYKLDVSGGDARFNGVVVGLGSGSIASNTVVGNWALTSNTTGYGNSAFGYQALQLNSTGSANSAFGFRALMNNTTGTSNTANGWGALYANTTGYNNTAVGRSALYYNTEGVANTALGQSALVSNTTGNNNSAIGYATLYRNTTGVSNTALWNSALRGNTEWYNNTAIGASALLLNTKGGENTAIGVTTLSLNPTGNMNIGIGNYTGRMIGGIGNIFIGQSAWTDILHIGYTGTATATANPRQINISPALNLAIAPVGSIVNVSFSGITISWLTEIALFDVINSTTLQLNAEYSGSYGSTGTATIDAITKVNPSTGDYRTIIGYGAGNSKGGGNNTILIGYNAEAPDATAPDQLNIGNWIFGSGGNIGIGSGTPRGEKLTVSGNAIISGGYVFIGNHDGVTNTNNDFVHYDDTNNIGFGGFGGVYSFINDKPRETTWTWANSLVAAGGGYFTRMVGIDGATSPSASLEVKRTTADANFAAWIEGTKSTNYGLGVNVAGTTSSTAIADFRSGNVSKLLIQSDGNVGIGTSSPTAKLEVAGQIKITGGAPGAGKVLTSDASGLASWSTGVPLYSYTETDPKIGANTTNYISKWNGSALVTSGLYENGGKVGIGTAAPAYTLDIAGNVNMSGNIGIGTGTPTSTKWVNLDIDMVNTSGMWLYSNVTASGTFTATRSNYGTYNIVTNAAENGAYTNAAYGSYNYALNTSSATGTGARNLFGSYNYARNNVATGSITNAYGWYFTVGNSTGSIANGYGVYIGNVDGNPTTTYGLYQSDAAGKNYFAGSVGIGTPTPGAKLDVQGGWTFVNNASSTTSRNYGIGLWSDTAFGMELGYDGAWSTRLFTRDTDGVITFGKSSGTNLQTHFTEQMRIANNGNVGIGTTTPGASLEVKRTAADGQFAAWIEGTKSTNYGLGVNIAGTTSATAIADFQSGNASKLYIRADGNVGIGTTAPSQKLQVAGTIYSTSGGYKFPDGTVQTTAATGGSTPAWAVMAFNLSACPTGWIPADGTNGTIDLRGQFIRGLNTSASGLDPNRTLASTQTSQNLSHGHAAGTLTAASAGTHQHTVKGQWGTSGTTGWNTHVNGGPLETSSPAGAHTHTITGNTATDGGTEARPNNIALLYCVKS